MRFLTRRGFCEVDRTWDSRLDVTRFDSAPFAGAEERVVASGIAITTLAEARASDPAVLPKLHTLFTRTEQDEPGIDPATALPYPEWVAREIDDPTVIPDVHNLICTTIVLRMKDNNVVIGINVLRVWPLCTFGFEPPVACHPPRFACVV